MTAENNKVAELVKETTEKLKGMSYSTATEVLKLIQREIEHNLTLH